MYLISIWPPHLRAIVTSSFPYFSSARALCRWTRRHAAVLTMLYKCTHGASHRSEGLTLVWGALPHPCTYAGPHRVSASALHIRCDHWNLPPGENHGSCVSAITTYIGSIHPSIIVQPLTLEPISGTMSTRQGTPRVAYTHNHIRNLHKSINVYCQWCNKALVTFVSPLKICYIFQRPVSCKVIHI